MNLVLTRVFIGEDGAFGTVAEHGKPPFAVTVERTFEGLKVIIPEGLFPCRRSRFVRGGYDTFEIAGVVGHDRLLFHKGNTEDDSEGCILLGLRYGQIAGKPAVLESQSAFTFFMARQTAVDSFTLEVRNV